MDLLKKMLGLFLFLAVMELLLDKFLSIEDRITGVENRRFYGELEGINRDSRRVAWDQFRVHYHDKDGSIKFKN